MTKPVITIQFPHPATPEVMGRALNFIEDVYRFANENATGAVDEMDSYGDGRFFVTLFASRHLGDMRRAISRLLKQHMLEDVAVMSRLDQR